METADVAKLEGVTPATIRADVIAGRLEIAAMTQRGIRLFRPEAVAAYRKQRLGRRKVRRPAEPV